jgi:hypothetical protein
MFADMRGWLLVAMVACGTHDPDEAGLQEIAATHLHELLTNPTESQRIETIHVQPTGPGSARYVITFKDRPHRVMANAEFPGKLIDEINAAHVMYDVRPRD